MKPVVALQDSPSRGICEGDILRPSDDGYVKSISNSFRAFKVDAIPTRKATLLEDYIDSSYVGFENIENHYLINVFDINDWVYTIKNVDTIPGELYEEVCDALKVRAPNFFTGFMPGQLHMRMHTSLESHGFVLKESWSKYYTEQVFEDFDDFMNFITSPNGNNIQKDELEIEDDGDCNLEWPDHGKMLNLSPTFLKFLELKYPASGKVDRNTRYFNNDAIGVAWNPAGFWLFSHSSSKPEIKIEDYETYMLDELKAAAPADEMFANDHIVRKPESELRNMSQFELASYYKQFGLEVSVFTPIATIIEEGERFLSDTLNSLPGTSLGSLIGGAGVTLNILNREHNNNNKLNNHEETNLFREKNGKIARISDSGFTIRSRTKQITGRTGSISNSQRPCKRRTIVGKPAKF